MNKREVIFIFNIRMTQADTTTCTKSQNDFDVLDV